MPRNRRETDPLRRPLRALHGVFTAGHLIVSGLFVLCALALIAASVHELWRAVDTARSAVVDAINAVLHTIALLTVAVAALELGQTLLEEEVQREADMSAPTRVRRFLSRFMVVLVVSLSIETLVLVFRLGAEAPDQLPYAAAVGIAAAALLLAWGAFVALNKRAEMLEPEAMERAKREDAKLK
jgi:hypothetical protein